MIDTSFRLGQSGHAEPAASAGAVSADTWPDDRSGAMPSISCVIPSFNEDRSLGRLLGDLRDVLSRCVNDWEIIVVDDGSTDASAHELERWSRLPGFQAIMLSRNFGKEAALTAGLEAASGDVVVMLDADSQHPPALIPVFLERWRRGADVVYALRENRRDESLFKRAATGIFYRLLNFGDRFIVPAGAGDFRLMDRAAVDALLALPERNRMMKGLYAWIGFRTSAVNYEPAPRDAGQSRFGLWQLLRLSIDGLTAFSSWPLRVLSIVGFALAALAFGYGAYLTLAYFVYGHTVSGWTTIVVSLMLFAGLQMISLGVVGEYIGRIFDEVKGRPLYVVRRRLGTGLKTPRHE